MITYDEHFGFFLWLAQQLSGGHGGLESLKWQGSAEVDIYRNRPQYMVKNASLSLYNI